MKHALIVAVFTISFMAFTPPTGDIPDVNVEAMFLYQFTKYVDWPSTKKSGDFVIAVYGPSKVGYKLETISQNKKVGKQPIKVITVGDEDDLTNTFVLFVPSNQSYNLPYIVSKVGNNPVLIVAERKGLTKKGAGISFFLADGKVKLEISKTNIETKGLKVAGELLKLTSQ